MPLGRATPVAFIHTTDIERARGFYCGLLELPVVEESPFALVVQAGPIHVRITPVPTHTPLQGTVFGWIVPDIVTTIGELAARGIPSLRFAGMQQDEAGIWQPPGSTGRVAWFADPDGNTLSVTQP